MSTKEKILGLLEANRDKYFSGEELARELNVSRTAVWKAIKSLQSEGYEVDAVTHKGYALSSNSDILSRQGIIKYLNDNLKNLKIDVFKTIDSTNTYIKKSLDLNLPEGYTVISTEQTAGRGRYGRSFFSPKNLGLYWSILLHPTKFAAKDAVKVTTMAAVAMCEAIEELTDLKPQIKWVNDIYIDGKKVCGILTEGVISMESGLLESAILGTGVNLYAPEGGFPEEIKDIATALFSESQKNETQDIQNHLIASFINRFFYYYNSGDDSEYSDKYRKYSFVIGKKITVVIGDKERSALVLGIDNDCQLEVKYDDGSYESLSHGEINIKDFI